MANASTWKLDYRRTWYCRDCGRFCPTCCGRTCASCCIQGREVSPPNQMLPLVESPNQDSRLVRSNRLTTAPRVPLTYWHGGKTAHVTDPNRILRQPPMREVTFAVSPGLSKRSRDLAVKPQRRPAWPWEQPRYGFNMQIPITYVSPVPGLDMKLKSSREVTTHGLETELQPISYHLGLGRDIRSSPSYLPVQPM